MILKFRERNIFDDHDDHDHDDHGKKEDDHDDHDHDDHGKKEDDHDDHDHDDHGKKEDDHDDHDHDDHGKKMTMTIMDMTITVKKMVTMIMTTMMDMKDTTTVNLIHTFG